jgi:UDP-sugar pyrophosphorylase
MQVYIESILALQVKAGGNAQLPLAIMTSGDTHAKTEKLLHDNAYFGMKPGQVTLLKQEKVSPHVWLHSMYAHTTYKSIPSQIRK